MTKSATPDWLQVAADASARDAFLAWSECEDFSVYADRRWAIMHSARALGDDYERWSILFEGRLAELIGAAAGVVSAERARAAQIVATYLDHPNLAGNDLALHLIAEMVTAIRSQT
ncbi:hypothetical protein ASD04_14840 [Devosia sp. Root436]|nr:hypothetical protein ASD04_14840 [Devosia sp. Root436]